MHQNEVPNLFRALSHYGSSQSENYLTEAFVYVLRNLNANAPAAYREFIGQLCDLSDDEFGLDGRVSVGTQSGLAEGRPDIRFDISDRHVVFVEVKDWSPLSDGQLEKYFRSIQNEFGERGKLVLLTRSRHSIQETELDPALYHHVCWYEVYSWIEDLDLSHEMTANYISEFMAFLEGKAMGVQKVGWEFEDGIKSMVVFTNLLETAVSEAWPDSKVRRSAGWSWRGLYVDEEHFIGFRFDEPTTLVFENNQGTNPTYKVDLTLQDVHFHSLSAGVQLENLTDFITSAMADADVPSSEEESP
jgi:hypothetical protein